MEITDYEQYIKELKKQIIRGTCVYSEAYDKYLDNMSIVELERELKNSTGKTYTELTGNRILF